MSMAAWNKDSLAAAWRELGLGAGDDVLVHSALRTLGEVEGGADTVLDSLLEVVGSHGHLMLPAFNYSVPLSEYFDPQTTPGRTGILSERARLRPEAKRSLHPTHSVVVFGSEASTLIDDHLKVRASGVGSPIDLLAKRGGKVVLIGVGQTSNSTVHIAEEHARIPKAASSDPLPAAQILHPDGRLLPHQLDSSPSCSAAFEAAAWPLRKRGAIQDARLGDALIQVMNGQAIIEIIGELLVEWPGALLCNRPGCATCPGTRANLGMNKVATR